MAPICLARLDSHACLEAILPGFPVVLPIMLDAGPTARGPNQTGYPTASDGPVAAGAVCARRYSKRSCPTIHHTFSIWAAPMSSSTFQWFSFPTHWRCRILDIKPPGAFVQWGNTQQ